MPFSHDHNFKNLILDYPREALAFFAADVGFTLQDDIRVTPLRQELPKDRLGDSFFEMDVPLRVEWPDGSRETLILIMEEETDPARFSIHRLVSYCAQLGEVMKTDAIVPVVIFLRAGKVRTALRQGSKSRTTLQFNYPWRMLGDMQAENFAHSDNVVARIVTACMRWADGQTGRVRAYGQAVHGLLALEPNERKVIRYLGFIDYYMKLDEADTQLYGKMYPQEEKQIMDLMDQIELRGEIRGEARGEARGVATTLRKVLAGQLAERFGPLDEKTQSRLSEASTEEMQQWVSRVLSAPSLRKLPL